MIGASPTRKRILDRGLAFASQAGLESVTLGVLAQEAGLSKSGLFAHFRSKEDMQIAVLERSAEVAAEYVVKPAMKKTEGLPRLHALIRGWFGWAPRAGLPGGCPVAAGLFEYDDVEGRVRDKIAEMEAEWRKFLNGVVSGAVSAGHLRRNVDVAQFVWELCGIYLSHHAATRFLRSPDADRRAKTAVDALIARSK